VVVGETLLKEGPHQALEEAVRGYVKDKDVKRVVIDPISPFSYAFDTPTEYRRFLHEFFLIMRSLDTLTYMVAEFAPSEITQTENYMADGVILLYLAPTDNPAVFKPGLQIRKMRGTEHPKTIYPLGFTRDGMRIL
jgi:KaiC/GvpD/RAD55 family RecA-like ATPase